MDHVRNRDQVGGHRRWFVGAGIFLPLALALSQTLAAHAGPAPAQSAFTPITPVRALDSRTAGQTMFHLAPGNEIDTWQVSGANGIPSARQPSCSTSPSQTSPTTRSLPRIPPAAGSPPSTSNVNATAGKASSAVVVVQLSSGGAIDIFNAVGSADIILDYFGYYSAVSTTAGPTGPTGATGNAGATGATGAPREHRGNRRFRGDRGNRSHRAVWRTDRAHRSNWRDRSDRIHGRDRIDRRSRRDGRVGACRKHRSHRSRRTGRIGWTGRGCWTDRDHRNRRCDRSDRSHRIHGTRR